ncbi:MAG: IclR family transcriptional regulator [Micromonosporaceae bacterium]
MTAERPQSQTLDRGLRVLELLAAAESPLSIAALATQLGVHRSIAYRIVRTLEDHRLVARAGDGLCELGVGLAQLARSVKSTLQTAALPELSELASDVAMTAFLVVRDHDEAVTVQSVEPRRSVAHVTYRPGSRHPVGRGAPGIALLAGEPPVPGERPEIAVARTRGWAWSRAEVLPGMSSVAAPVYDRRRPVAAVAVVYVEPQAPDRDALAARVTAAAEAIGQRLP